MRKSIILLLFFAPGIALQAQSVSYDMKVGAETALKIEAQYGVSNYPAPTQLLDSIGQRLVKRLGNQPFKYQFKVLNMVEPNAMTLPAGYIYFSKGILALANSEDELACVMGHEIIHAHKRHTIKSAKKGILPALIELPGNLIKVVSPSLGKMINAPIEGATELFQANYSRQNENEADYLGVKLAAMSGYDPMALGNILQRINSTVELLTGEKQKFSYFDSHPWTGDRVKNITIESKSLTIASVDKITSNASDFLSRLDGIMISSDPGHGVLRDSLFLHPDLGFSVLLPPGWKYTNTPTALVATEKGGKAQLMLGVAGPASDPEAYAKKFMEAAAKDKNMNVIRKEEIIVNGHLGYLITITEQTRKGPVTAHVLWLNLKELTYPFIGIGTKAHEEAMKQSVLSFRTMTFEERTSIHTLVLRIEEALEGETLQSFSQRSGNVASLNFLALMNDLSKETPLHAGQRLKIVKREPY
jgi:predicted Zn-dependent protease